SRKCTADRFLCDGRGSASSLRRSIDKKIHLLFLSPKQKSLIANAGFIPLIFIPPAFCFYNPPLFLSAPGSVPFLFQAIPLSSHSSFKPFLFQAIPLSSHSPDASIINYYRTFFTLCRSFRQYFNSGLHKPSGCGCTQAKSIRR
ncbi:MAG: hypothetical protein K2P69_02420, partial [Eubacterium sp.]|nr:hypothetical protein [Eubacterium sp.]